MIVEDKKLNSKKHYVYLLISNTEEKFYIGARSCSCRIDEDSYMGSSSVMTKEDKDNCDKLVLKEFDTRKEAIAYEVELHNQFEVSTNEKFWNKAKQTSTGFDTTGRSMSLEEKTRRGEIQKERFKKSVHPSKGRVLTEEQKRKISESGTGLKRSEETKHKIQEAHKARSSKHWKFEPWWYEVNGVRVDVLDITIRQFAEDIGVNFNVVKDRFKSKFEGKELTRGPLKGYRFGRIKNDK